MAKDTKERIIEAALEIFARDGYSGTNIRDIAEAVGIVKSALYRHFESKEEIWNAVHNTMIAYYEERFGTADKLPCIPSDTDELLEMTMRMVKFTVNDKNIINMRKILLTEQFRDERAKKLASNYFLYDTREIFTKVFREMMNNGSIRKTDPGMLALSYTAPVTALIHLCDREPALKDRTVEEIEEFVRFFIGEYKIPE